MNPHIISETKDLKLKANAEKVIINEGNPFLNDKLSREPHIKALTKIIEAYHEGAVIALNGAWGSGKTTFVKMWERHLKNNDFNVVYYNAWEDDLNYEPLISMLRNLKSNSGKQLFKKVLKTGVKILTNSIFGAMTEMSSHCSGFIGKGINSGIKKIENLCLEALEKKDDTSSIMKEFKSCLEKYINKVYENGKPLVYFIDELDRCNPHFAVKVLERMKHLFDIPNIIFVLAVDKQQLSYSINGYFGSDMINSQEYLRRFIDIYYDLPEPASHDYCEYLFDYHGFDNLIHNDDDENDEFVDCLFALEVLIKLNKVTLRQLEKIFLAVRFAYLDRDCKSIVLDFDGYEKYIASVLFVMAYIKICNPTLYDGIKSLKYSLQELCEELENLDVNHKEITDNFNTYTLTMMYILYLYYWDLHCSNHRLSGILDHNDTDYVDRINYCYSTLCSLEFNTFNRKLLTKYKSSFESVNTGLKFWLDRMDISDVYFLRLE